jgi:polyferredoxin
MGAPFFHALRGKGKIHCSKHCPRGSFLGKFLSYISMNNPLPKFMRTKIFKNLILIIMISLFSLSIIHSGFVFEKMAFAFFRFMGISFIVGIVLGIFFKPRSWCQICPMGHGTGLIEKALQKNIYKKPNIT